MSNTPTLTPGGAPTTTPTNPPVPNGGTCMTSADCASLNCINGVCEPVNPAPAASARGLVAGLVILVGLGGLGVWRMRRPVR